MVHSTVCTNKLLSPCCPGSSSSKCSVVKSDGSNRFFCVVVMLVILINHTTNHSSRLLPCCRFLCMTILLPPACMWSGHIANPWLYLGIYLLILPILLLGALCRKRALGEPALPVVKGMISDSELPLLQRECTEECWTTKFLWSTHQQFNLSCHCWGGGQVHFQDAILTSLLVFFFHLWALGERILKAV